MKLIMLLVKNEGTTKNMMVEESTPRAISLRTLLQERRGAPKFTEYARLNTAQSQILMEIEKDKDIK